MEVSRRELSINSNRKSLSQFIDEVKLKRVNDAKKGKLPAEKKTKSTGDCGDIEDADGATVHVGQDPNQISLSACRYNQSLITYLKAHPLTIK